MDGIKSISPEEAEQLIGKNKGNGNFSILDFRTPGEFRGGHIEGALNIDFFSDTFRHELEGLDKGKTYLVHCRTMNRTVPAAGLMRQLGFRHVYVMEGGIMAWEYADLPVVHA